MDLTDCSSIAAIAAKRGRGSIHHQSYRSAPYSPRGRGVHYSRARARPYRNLSLVNNRRPTANHDDEVSTEPIVSTTRPSTSEHSMQLYDNIYEYQIVGQSLGNDTSSTSRTLSIGMSIYYPNDYV
jgi:hypothetical protein